MKKTLRLKLRKFKVLFFKVFFYLRSEIIFMLNCAWFNLFLFLKLCVFEFTPDFTFEYFLSESVSENFVVNDVNSWNQESDVLSPNFYELFNKFRVIFDLLVSWNVHDHLNHNFFNSITSLGILTLRQKLAINLVLYSCVFTIMLSHNIDNILVSQLEL